MKIPSLPIRNTRFGFHYVEDLNHYREYDLANWLPVLQSLGASWVLLKAPVDRAIPEYFISGMVQGGVEPILHFSAPVDDLSSPTEIEPILAAYQRWGCHLVIFSNKPNARPAWRKSGWTQEDLVERFLDHFLPFASAAMQNGLLPVLPPFEPGGDYWDTAFLRSALEALERRKQNQLLDNLVLSAYAWTHNRDLNWGIGGPERWPDAHPYFTPEESQDQLGLRIGDWYQAIAGAVIQKPCPVILLQYGQPTDPRRGVETDKDQLGKTNLTCGKLLNGEEVNGNQPLAPSVMAAMYWNLFNTDPQDEGSAWFSEDGTPSAFVNEWRTWLKDIHSQPGGAKTFIPAASENHPLGHYLLLPHADAGLFDWQWEAVRPFVKKYAPTIGFSILEAALAVRVTVLGSEEEFPEEALNQLRSSGCWVERVEGNGTDVATSLAER